jgi:hypothetical protein
MVNHFSPDWSHFFPTGAQIFSREKLRAGLHSTHFDRKISFLRDSRYISYQLPRLRVNKSRLEKVVITTGATFRMFGASSRKKAPAGQDSSAIPPWLLTPKPRRESNNVDRDITRRSVHSLTPNGFIS